MNGCCVVGVTARCVEAMSSPRESHASDDPTNLMSRFLRATVRQIVNDSPADAEEAEALLARIENLEETTTGGRNGRRRGATPRQASDGESGAEGDSNAEGEDSEQSALAMLREMPFIRMAKTLAPFIGLVLVKLLYELLPYVISLVLIVLAYEYLDSQFRTHISLSKSMLPSTRWITSLLCGALSVAVLSHVVLESMTAIKGLNESLLFCFNDCDYADSTSSILTLIWALLILASLANVYVLIAELAIVCIYTLWDSAVGTYFGEGAAHRDDDTNSIEESENFLSRYERLTAIIDSTHYVGFLWRSALPTGLWLEFYGEARFAASSLQIVYIFAKIAEFCYKSYAVYLTLGRTLRGGKALIGVPTSLAEIEELGADRTCPICMETLDADRCPVRLEDCGHIFCQRCIQTWASGKPNPTCAVCRAPVSVNEKDKEIDLYEAELKSHSSRWVPIIL